MSKNPTWEQLLVVKLEKRIDALEALAQAQANTIKVLALHIDMIERNVTVPLLGKVS